MLEPLERSIDEAQANIGLFERMDAQILVLDDIIAQLEEEHRRSPLYQYRLNKAKRLLNSNISVK